MVSQPGSGRANDLLPGAFCWDDFGDECATCCDTSPKKTPMIDDVPNAIFIHYPDELTSPKSSHWRLFCDLSLGSISELNAPCRTAGGTGTDKKKGMGPKVDLPKLVEGMHLLA